MVLLQLMLRHHEGGTEMLRFTADHAAVPQARDLAARMSSAQTTESEYLRLLLAERGGMPLPMQVAACASLLGRRQPLREAPPP